MMESSIFKQAAKLIREQKNSKRWLMMFLCLAMVVALGTVAALTVPGQAQTHTKTVLECPLVVHQHTDDCYNSEKELICGQADYVVHTHNDDCYEDGKLVCQLPEIEPHEHTDDCYREEKVLTCELEESAGHQHSDECYTEEQGELTCGLKEHQHSDECFDEENNLICEQEEHEHSDSCYATEKVLICEQEESKGHQHSDSCYTTENVLTCGKLELHTHDKKTCYDENGNLICTKLALEEHIHSEQSGCFKTVELTDEEVRDLNQVNENTQEPVPETDPADGNTLPDSSADGSISLPELPALPDNVDTSESSEPDASVENPESANSQEETAEPEPVGNCYDENGNLICGKEAHTHSELCMNAEGEPICGIEEHVHVGAPEPCYDEMGNLICEKQEHTHDTTCYDETGNLICEKVEHMHIHAEIASCYDQEGNLICQKQQHTHDASCYDETGNLICTIEEHIHIGAPTAKTLERVYEDEQIKVTATFPAEANIPEEAELKVKRITDENDPEHFEERLAQAQEALGENVSVNPIALLEIGFYLPDGSEVQPAAEVNITMHFLDESGVAVGDPIKVIHFAENGTEVLNASDFAEDATTNFITPSFSEFMPVNTGDGSDNEIATIAGTAFDRNFTHNKRIDYLGDGADNPDTTADNPDTTADSQTVTDDLYRLYLDMEGKSTGVDLLFVIDRSASMAGADNTRSDKQVYNLLYGTDNNGTGSMIKEFLDSNTKNKVSVVWFAGKHGQREQNIWPTASSEGGVVQGWTSGFSRMTFDESVRSQAMLNKNPDSTSIEWGEYGITNYVAGYFQADMQLKDETIKNDDNKKVVIFLSDGLPTVYYNYTNISATGGDLNWDDYENGTAKTEWYIHGTGNESSLTSESTEYVVNNEKMFDQFVTRNSDINFYAVGFKMDGYSLSNNKGVKRNIVLDYMAKKYDSTGSNLYNPGNADQLKNALRSIMYPSGVTISDKLSAYVDLYSELPDIKVTATKRSDDTVTDLWSYTGTENALSGSGTITLSGTFGSALEGTAATDIIKNVTYDTSSKTITLNFVDAYCLSSAYTYTLSFNVQLTEKAYDDYTAEDTGDTYNSDSTLGKVGDPTNAYVGGIGASDTDYGRNSTSSGHTGFHSNDEAKVHYFIDGQDGNIYYEHPVVQAWKAVLRIHKVDEKGKALEGIGFLLLRSETGSDGLKSWTPIVPYDTNCGGPYTVPDEMMEIDPNGQDLHDQLSEEQLKEFYQTKNDGTITYGGLKHGFYKLFEIVPAEYQGATAATGQAKQVATFKVNKGRIYETASGDDINWYGEPDNPDENLRNGYYGEIVPSNPNPDPRYVQTPATNCKYLVNLKITNHDLNQRLQIVKQDEEENPLQGAEFALYKKDVYDAGTTETPATPLYTLTSGADGELVDNDNKELSLAEGEYVLVETKAPTGYSTVGPIYLKVYAANIHWWMNASEEPIKDGTDGCKVLEPNGGVITLTITDPRKMVTVNFLKKDGTQTKYLAGAVFELYDENYPTGTKNLLWRGQSTVTEIEGKQVAGWAFVDEKGNIIDEDAEGYVAFPQLAFGKTYYMVETAAPDGYNLLGEPLVIRVDDNGKVTVTKGSGEAEDESTTQTPLKPLEGYPKDGIYIYDIPNYTGYELPKSGGSGTTYLYTLGGVFLALAGTALLYKKSARLARRKEGN